MPKEWIINWWIQLGLDCTDHKMCSLIKFSGILSAKCRNQSFGDICGRILGSRHNSPWSLWHWSGVVFN